MKIKKILKPYFLIPIILIIIILLMFLVWLIIPSKTLDVAVLDKTVPAASQESESDKGVTTKYYRKHEGLFWLLNNQKYVKSSDKSKYNSKTDYFGPKIDESGTVTDNDELSTIDYTPDLMYVADVYGSELYDNEYKGLSNDDMSVVSLTHSSGGTVVAEMELFNSTNSDSVKTEMRNLCGISSTNWSGRYVEDLSDLSDVPEWAPPDYEEQYGVEWRFSGPGLILVNTDSTIIVLEEKTDFNSKNLMQIVINDDYKSEFSSCSKANFYNWFELIQVNSGTESIASFKLDLNATGMEKIKDISSTPVFTAVTRKTTNNEAPVYYFAGDFNDYVQKQKVGSFIFADKFFKALSFDKEGDVTNFYWNFYNPLMKKILKNAYKVEDTNESDAQKTQISKIENNKFQVYYDKKWNELNIKGFNINADEPSSTSYSRNYSYYNNLLQEAGEIGANCIRAKALLPPEFYRALYDYNKDADSKMYLMQTISLNNGADVIATEDGIKTDKQNIDNALNAINGNAVIESSEDTLRYIHDVSTYVIGYIIDSNVDSSKIEVLNSSFTPDYNSSLLSCAGSGTNAYLSTIADYFYNQQMNISKFYVPLGLEQSPTDISSAFWNENKSTSTYDLKNIFVADAIKEYYFNSLPLNINDNEFTSNEEKFNTYSDANGSFPYGAYIAYVKGLNSDNPLLIDSFGVSTNSSSYESLSYSGLTEAEQGNYIVRMLTTINSSGFLGGLISDLNDSWSSVSSTSSPFTVPEKNAYLWHDLTDPNQTTGIISAQANEPTDVGIEFPDFETMKKTQLFTNSEYFYITIMLEKEIDFNQNELYIGLDTYQRNDGEYLFNKKFYANSLSGMEYMIKITDNKTAKLYVTSSYNRKNNKFSSKESYSGKWSLVSTLQYGNFTTSTTQFYVASTNIRIRIPWSLLNFTDPSQKLIVNQSSDVINDKVATTSTNGIIFYMYLGNNETKDTDYIFPLSKDSTGYKTFKFSTWEKTEYTLKRKASYTIIKTYFNTY